MNGTVGLNPLPLTFLELAFSGNAFIRFDENCIIIIFCDTKHELTGVIDRIERFYNEKQQNLRSYVCYRFLAEFLRRDFFLVDRFFP